MGDLFRKKPLEHAAGPEKLDDYIKVTNPGVWSLLIACIAIVVAAAVWLAIGTIPTTLDIRGVVFPGSGALSVTVPVSGEIQDMRVSSGDTVYPHDILAVVSQPELRAELEALMAAETPDEAAAAQKRQEYIAASVIRSDTYGVVLDAKHRGDIVSENDEIASLALMEEGTNNYQIICYVPADTARRLSAGMEAQVCPSFLSREEYGYMYGYIESVGEHPVTDSNIEAAVGSRQYVEEVLSEGSLIEVRITITLDPEAEGTANSALWSNPIGNTVPLSTGMACDILVVLDEQKPYELLLRS